MTASTASRPPAGMPPHLWELAKRDVRGAVPERVRQATDDTDNAPASIRAIARRAATASATFGVAAAAVALGASTATAGPAVELTGFDGAVPPPGPGLADLEGFDTGPGSGGQAGPDGPGGSGGSGGFGGDGGGSFGATRETHGSLDEGPVSSGLGTSFQVHHEDAPGPEPTLTVSIFQDVAVVETADGNFLVDAYQYIVIRDSEGHEYTFIEHYQVTVPDPPGQETDLMIHETGHVQVIENPDGSFTPVSVDHGIEVTVGSDGDGRDEIGIRQVESVQVTEHGRPDADDTTIVLGEEASTESHDTGDEAYTEIDQSTATGSGNSVNQNGGRPETPTDPQPTGTTGGNGTGGTTGAAPGRETPPTTGSSSGGASAGTTTGATSTGPTTGGTTAGGTTTGGTTSAPTTGPTPLGTSAGSGHTPTVAPSGVVGASGSAGPAGAGTPGPAGIAGATGLAGAASVVPLESSLSAAPTTTVAFSGRSSGAAGDDPDGTAQGTIGGTGTAGAGAGDLPSHDQVFGGHAPATVPDTGPFQGATPSAPDPSGTGTLTPSNDHEPVDSPGGTARGTDTESGNDDGEGVHETSVFESPGDESSGGGSSAAEGSGHEASGSSNAGAGGDDGDGTTGSEDLESIQ